MFPETVADPNYTAATSFDARTKWGGCVHSIRDQASCGSCWAFGSSEALSDRFCINGGVNTVLSPQDLVSCDSSDLACNGGYLDRAWNYLASTGIVTDACFPYASGGGAVPRCPSSCTGSGSWTKYKCRAGSVVHPRTVAAIQ
jgi:cathepsin B